MICNQNDNQKQLLSMKKIIFIVIVFFNFNVSSTKSDFNRSTLIIVEEQNELMNLENDLMMLEQKLINLSTIKNK